MPRDCGDADVWRAAPQGSARDDKRRRAERARKLLGASPRARRPFTCVARDGGFDLCTLLWLLNAYARVELCIGVKVSSRISETRASALTVSEYFARRH